MTHRLAQTLIIQQLNHANELVQAALLELIVTKEIRMTNVRYNTPKPYFLNIVILPESGSSLLRNDEIKSLAEQASKVHINIDITRYIRDIIVGIRTHPLVSGGLTARTSQDLVSVTR
ncbi:uncharacterized protein BX664DRAFT_255770 [Halteromyces radiatus]|uniref:uncharacterized protein n=1 Tax=Halteromyces radiatus TaxID=101107 RepID=UPI002220D082|nr:uncharacterized protein BX664DRAFT_255770 [Halteromyces radiatus]KAI8099754.1 hypothetical protein BX664DRAFT_255770 [Halteromyces radiatus]